MQFKSKENKRKLRKTYKGSVIEVILVESFLII